MQENSRTLATSYMQMLCGEAHVDETPGPEDREREGRAKWPTFQGRELRTPHEVAEAFTGRLRVEHGVNAPGAVSPSEMSARLDSCSQSARLDGTRGTAFDIDRGSWFQSWATFFFRSPNRGWKQA